MGDLDRNVNLVNSANFEYGSQNDLVRMVRLTDPDDLELSLTLMATTSPRMQEIYSKIAGFRGRIVGVDQDYSDTTINIPGPRKALPSYNPEDILPLGIRAFIADLDEFIQLSEEENVVPLLRLIKKEDRNPAAELIRIYAPKIDNEGKKFDPSDVGRLNQLIEEELYFPRLEQLKSIGGLARGLRPGMIAYVDVRRDPTITKDCLKALDSIPDRNIITYFRIGAKPRDEGGREYYDWQCSTVMQMWPGEKTFRMEFDKPTDVEEMVRNLSNHGINLKIVTK